MHADHKHSFHPAGKISFCYFHFGGFCAFLSPLALFMWVIRTDILHCNKSLRCYFFVVFNFVVERLLLGFTHCKIHCIWSYTCHARFHWTTNTSSAWVTQIKARLSWLSGRAGLGSLGAPPVSLNQNLWQMPPEADLASTCASSWHQILYLNKQYKTMTKISLRLTD